MSIFMYVHTNLHECLYAYFMILDCLLYIVQIDLHWITVQIVLPVHKSHEKLLLQNILFYQLLM